MNEMPEPENDEINPAPFREDEYINNLNVDPYKPIPNLLPKKNFIEDPFKYDSSADQPAPAKPNFLAEADFAPTSLKVNYSSIGDKPVQSDVLFTGDELTQIQPNFKFSKELPNIVAPDMGPIDTNIKNILPLPKYDPLADINRFLPNNPKKTPDKED